MPIAERHVDTTWEGDLASGTGTFGNSSSGVLDGQRVTWGSRTEAPEGKTSPEELAAAAHSACFSMALNVVLGNNKLSPTKLVVGSTVTFDEVDGKPTVTKSALTVRGTVSGTDEAAFRSMVEEAAALCPISRLFAGAEITVEATLEA